MNSHRPCRAGYTLVEVVASVAILTFTMTGAIAGWLYCVRGERMNSVQNELDIDVRKAMERIRADLRLTTRDQIFYWPSGSNRHTGVSFPMTELDPDTGMAYKDLATGKIKWMKTIVYHVRLSTPNELCRTVFNERDNTLTDAQRQQQLDSVVANGNGISTFEGGNVTTVGIFQNLFTWWVTPRGSPFDAYSSDLGRASVNFGSALLTTPPYSHNFTFTVIGKNPASSGHKIGLDTLTVTPCAVGREAEAQFSAVSATGGTVEQEFMSAGSWQGNYQLAFAASGAGSVMTIPLRNDQWEETNFRGTGSVCDNTMVEFMQSGAGTPSKDYVVLPSPPTNAWQADWQTLTKNPVKTSTNPLSGVAIRVPIRGILQEDGGAIKHDGPLHCIHFYSGYNPLGILVAYVSEAVSPTSYWPDAVNGGVKLSFDGADSKNIGAGSSARGEVPSGVQFWIDRTKTYFVTFLVGAGQGDATYWAELHTNNPVPPGSYIIPASYSPGVATVADPIWTTKLGMTPVPGLFAVDHLHVLAISNGYFTSQIVDTHMEAPVYTELSWNQVEPVPSGTAIKMKVRTGSDPALVDAPSWSNVGAMATSGAIAPGNGRYVQWQAQLSSDSTLYKVPRLKDVTVKWNGESRMVDVGAEVTTGPGYGIFDVTVDGKPLVKGVTVDLTIYEDIRSYAGGSNRLTSTMTAEVEPRNTGK